MPIEQKEYQGFVKKYKKYVTSAELNTDEDVSNFILHVLFGNPESFIKLYQIDTTVLSEMHAYAIALRTNIHIKE